MALKLEFINVIVPIRTIREKLGQEAYERRYSLVDETTWHDEYLFRDGCMNGHDLDGMLEEWEGHGLELTEVVDGVKQWKDLCVVHSRRGPTGPCPWIEYDPLKNVVWMKGTLPGEPIGPSGRQVAGETPDHEP